MTQYMPLFRSCSTIRTLTQLHAHLFITGQHTSQLASTKLIESYAQMNSLHSANLVFQSFHTPDSFMYGVLIKHYVWYGLYKQALTLYSNMLHKLTIVSSFIFPSVLRACSGFHDLGLGKNVHGRIIKHGFESDRVIRTSLLSMYGEVSDMVDARKVFDEMPERDVVSWSCVISMYVRNGKAGDGLKLFCEMMRDGYEPDYVTLLSVAEACGELGLRIQSKSIHGYIVTNDIESGDLSTLNNSLIAMYGKCGELYNAKRLFNRVSNHCTSSWTAMITCYNHNGYYLEALNRFNKMLESKTEPNEITMMVIICSCARLCFLREGKSIHGFVIRKNLDPDNDILGPTLIDLYANCGKLKTCHKIIDISVDEHVISWNMLISGYTREGNSEEALNLFKRMRIQRLSPDEFTITSVVSACGNTGFVNLGTQIHCYVIKAGALNEFVLNSLIDMYAKFGYVDLAYSIFDKQHHKSVVTWNSMMWGFCNNGESIEALNLFNEMYLDGVEMDDVSFLSAIRACSDLRDLVKGKWIHHKLITSNMMNDTYVLTALLDMYAKCGELQMARCVFEVMPYKSVVSWSAMIDAYGMHGLVDMAILVYDMMIESDTKPNEITFMNILSACSHAGYVEKGKYYFDSMKKDFGIEPKLEHFSCLIDLLSRAGHLDDAYSIANSIPFPPNSGIWGSLLSGCRIHRRLDMIELIQEKIEKINDTGYYTLLSNISAEEADWEQFQTVRSMMKANGLKKLQGSSMVRSG
ncbi:putative pentatricopeptide repeat-containing protein At1g69350, mitochondrial [Rutidosis leptorrhynchoides]|uniref:putative pentatricopeptide repeat-containing protein At1g69350, mitochondrial n=1 Tax=Rutidosis leptorrhynchoides TaxID=125765 RepID=UPI003A99B3E9